LTQPRIAPGTRADIGLVNHTIARVIGLAAGGAPPNIFLTLGRHRAFRPWLRFAGKLMPGGRLPRRDSELVILRVAHLCSSPYEWGHHERLGRQAGLTADEIERVRSGPGAPGWSPRQALLLGAADALHNDRDIDDALWAALDVEFGEEELIELCLLIGHYEMLAMTLNALRVQPDPVSIGNRPWLIRVGEKVLQR
jgi:alkylhydroperoxidase family enzyme